MANSIRQIRKTLNISADDLAFYLGFSKGRLYHLESGADFESPKTREKLKTLSNLVKRNQKNKNANPWFKDDVFQLKAKKFNDAKRKAAAIRAEVLTNKLVDMKVKYDHAIKALDILASMMQDSECTKEIKNWIQVVAPRIVKSATKNNPLEQAKIAIRIQELGIIN